MTTSCDSWLGDLLEAEGIIIDDSNRAIVDRVVRRQFGEQMSGDGCGDNWIIVRNHLSKDPLARRRLAEQIRMEAEQEQVVSSR